MRPVESQSPTRKVLAVDVGLKSLAGFTPLLKRGAETPASFVGDFSTAEDNQPGVTLTVLSRDPVLGEVHELGEFNIDGIEPAARGVPRLQVTVTVMESGMVVAVAQDRDTGKKQRAEFGPVQLRDE
jgi:molecular chaperone DnaK